MTDQADEAVIPDEPNPNELDLPTITDDEPIEDTVDDEQESSEGISDEGEEQEPEPEYTEIEFEGKHYEVPKELQAAIMKNADYTQKTQTLAEERRALEEQQQQVQQTQQQLGINFEKRAELVMVEKDLQKYSNVNWVELSQQQPDKAQAHQANFLQLQNRHQALSNEISQAEQHAFNEQQQQTVKRIEESKQRLSKEIEGWSDTKAVEMGATAKSLGFTDNFVNAVNSGAMPDSVPVLKLLDKAQKYDQLVEKLEKKPADKTVIPIKKKVAGKKTVARTVYNAKTPEEFRELREKQIARKK